MLSRSSQAAADLLGCQSLPICRKCMLSPALRRHDVFLRSNSRAAAAAESERQNRIKRNRRVHRKKLEDSKGRWGTKVPISVTSLGEPAEVLLVKDRERRQFPGRVKDMKSADQNSLSLMMDDVDASESLVDEEMVTENIEFLRRYKPGDKLSLDEWHDHRQEIRKSFTNKQMSVYISEFLIKEEEEGEETPEHGQEVPGKWRPGISTFLETANVHDSNRVTRSQETAKAKDILVERILRDCWKLGIIGETGQLDYQLSPLLLSLLVQSANFSFVVLASLHDAQVDLTHSLGLVRITGSQKACEALRDVVHDATARIRQEDIHLYSQNDPRANAANRIFNPEFLSWVSTTYGVAIEQYGSEPSKLFYLAENKRGADDARRTLNLAIHDKSAPQSSFGTYVSALEPIEYHDFSPGDNTAWWNRGKPWFRWAVPPAQSAEAESLETPFFDNHEARLSDELLKLLRRKSHPKTVGDNNTKVRETVSAAVGRCLFLRKPSLVDEKINANQLGKLGVPRIFSTDVPQVTSILHSLRPFENSTTERHHRIQLVPSAMHANVFPALEVDFMVYKTLHNEDSPMIKVAVKSARAILSKNKVDYLLPENGLDLRFTRTLTRELMGTRRQKPMQNLQQLLQDTFSRARTNREDMPLPAFINLSLPNHALASGSTDMDPSGETTAEYMFLPVRSIQSTRIHGYRFQGNNLTYSYFESGPYYAHRTTDLSLDMDIAEGSSGSAPIPQMNSPGSFGSFYKDACALAFDVDKAWRAKFRRY